MSEAAKRLIDAEDRATGRVIPEWRVRLITWLTTVSVGVTPLFQGSLWMTLVTIFVNAFVATLLLEPYRRRSIS
ncbi:hypothetical protein [Plantibacter sp. YIM 135249]|uniref:hypothetical protein n=1 Tax=Plantibacter sp. YIM 135249 TaxID=3423918 RepID=UPI003D34B778